MTHHTHPAADRTTSPGQTHTAASFVPPLDAAGFLVLKGRVADLQRQVDALKPQGSRAAKAGYFKKLDRLRDARTALLFAENKLNRN